MTIPFVNEPFTFTNPDGTKIQVRGWGDSFFAIFETPDGYTVISDPATGFYHYATLSDDKRTLLPSGTRVGAVDPTTLGVEKHLRYHPNEVRKMASTAREIFGPKPRWQIRREQKRLELDIKLKSLSGGILPQPLIQAAPPAKGTTGNYVGLCILIQFPDVPGTITQLEVEQFCNLPGYNQFGNNGSVYDYFRDNSGNLLNYTNIVTQYYTAQHNRDYYTNPDISCPIRAQELIREALDHLVDQGFDFSQLSSDNNGYVYCLNVFYAGGCINNWAEGLWPHSWSLFSEYPATEGKIFSDYQITYMGNELTLKTFCHENGHMLCDFPDLYDYGYESNGVGNYCLMAYGGYMAKNPVQVNAYLKYKAGWASQVTAITPGVSNVPAGDNRFFIYVNSCKASEYFIIENRQKQDRDTALPDSGLAIWHVDELGSNDFEQMTSTNHYECSLEQADNNFNLESGDNYGDATDLFASPQNIEFSDETSPNAHWWNDARSGLSICQISTSGPVMQFSHKPKNSFYHLSPIIGHQMQADIDFSGLGYPAKFALAGDFDGDGNFEIAVAAQARDSAGNDFWVMKFDPATRTWRHLFPLAGHPMQADIDFSTLGYTAKFAVVGDFDGDGKHEIAVAPTTGGSKGNDLWVMKYIPSSRTWRHLSPIAAHPMHADIDCSGLAHPVKFGVVGDFDGCGRQEIALAIETSGSGGNDFWVMKFDPATRKWNHLTPIVGHPLQADIDFSGLSYPAKFVVTGDFDGDGQKEIAVAPVVGSSGGNDLWVMKYSKLYNTWRHFSQIPGHPMQADLDCSGLSYPAKFAVVGDFDGDRIDEIAVAPEASGSAGNDFWVMKYDPTLHKWKHLSPIPGHPMQADIDFSGFGYPAKFAVVGDFDGCGSSEIAVAPNVIGSRGNDFWVTKFNKRSNSWRHLSPITGHPIKADIDCSCLGFPARFALTGDYDGDNSSEIAIAPASESSGGNDFWVMKYFRG
jgi:M6 family metalloprotease-like protein